MKLKFYYFIPLLCLTYFSCEKDKIKSTSTRYLVSKEIRIDDDTDTIISTYLYSNNNLVEMNFAEQSLFTYQYNDTSVLMKIEDTNGRLYKVSNTLIENGLGTQLVSLWPKDGKGELLPTGDTIFFTYDLEGRLIETIQVEGPDIVSKTVNTWDSNGDLVKTETFAPPTFDSPSFSEEYTYYLDKYDSRDYGLSYQGKKSIHLIKTQSMIFYGQETLTSYSYSFDNIGRPKTETKLEGGYESITTITYK